MSHLHEASQQWATRPDDERFWNLQEFNDHCVETRQRSAEIELPYRSIRAIADGEELAIAGPSGNTARMTNWAFNQLAVANSCPPSFLSELPPSMAADVLNHKLQLTEESKQANILFHQNGGLTARSVNSDKYGRIWNSDLTRRLLNLDSQGWRVPPARPCRENQAGARPATEADLLEVRKGGLSIHLGDMIAPAGLYASDRDMFCFLINENNRVDDGTDDGLSRGFFLSNSEVGNGTSLKLTTFLYRHCCGNHIVWNASEVREFRMIHRGNTSGRIDSAFVGELRKYADHSGQFDSQKIAELKRVEIGNDRDSVIDALFGKRILGRRTLELCYDKALEQAKADQYTYTAKSAWGVAQGITAYSQSLPYAAERTKLDRAAGLVLDMAS